MIDLYYGNITDILPDYFRNDPKVKALGFAMSKAIKKLIDYSIQTRVFSAIDNASDEVVDLLALELNTQYYEESLDITVKRNLVKNTFLWYKNAGTTKTVRELISTIFGEGEIVEWWQNEEETDPFTFRIITEAPITGDEVAEFTRMIANVTNVRSHLDAIEFLRTTSGNCYIGCGQSSYTVNKDIKEGGFIKCHSFLKLPL